MNRKQYVEKLNSTAFKFKYDWRTVEA